MSELTILADALALRRVHIPLNERQHAVLDSLITSVVVEFVATTAAALNIEPSEWEFKLDERAFVRKEPAP